MTELAKRGLVFRLSPHPQQVALEGKGGAWPTPQKYRYVLHRVVQRHAVASFGLGNRDSISQGSFAPTVRGAMRSAREGLSQTDYAFVRSLMIALSQYPDIPQNDDSLQH